MIARMVATTERERSSTSVGARDRAALDLSAAYEQTRRIVAEGLVPSAVMAVSDASGNLGTIAVPGPRNSGIREDSLFFLASVTKPIVATAVMQLVDEGRLSIHDPICRYVPEFGGPDRNPITVWHVLTHTSGLPDMDMMLYLKKRLTAEQALARVCAETPTFEPGSRYSYASDSFYLLAAIISRLTGQPFAEALRRRVLAPVGADDIRFDPRALRSRIVRVHGVGVDNRLVQEVVLRFLARATLPGGGLWGSAADLLRFGRSLLPRGSGTAPRILSQAAIDEMTREQTKGIFDIREDGTPRDPHYALGWGKPHPAGLAPSVVDDSSAPDGGEVVRVPASPSTFTHGGASGTRLWIDPERELVFVFLTNHWGVSDQAMFSVLREVYTAWDAARA
jgi:CubicO group peptidase (beta-lactamase class C family)